MDYYKHKINNIMKTEEYQAIGVNIKVEIFDLDMREAIWPLDGDDDPGIWLPKELADKYTDDQLGKWFLNRCLIDYGNSFEYTVTRGEEKMMTFKRRVKKVNSDTLK
jgi:hypothetical protein